MKVAVEPNHAPEEPERVAAVAGQYVQHLGYHPHPVEDKYEEPGYDVYTSDDEHEDGLYERLVTVQVAGVLSCHTCPQSKGVIYNGWIFVRCGILTQGGPFHSPNHSICEQAPSFSSVQA
jgi:hypothetical protein